MLVCIRVLPSIRSASSLLLCAPDTFYICKPDLRLALFSTLQPNFIPSLLPNIISRQWDGVAADATFFCSAGDSRVDAKVSTLREISHFVWRKLAAEPNAETGGRPTDPRIHRQRAREMGSHKLWVLFSAWGRGGHTVRERPSAWSFTSRVAASLTPMCIRQSAASSLPFPLSPFTIHPFISSRNLCLLSLLKP